jgi:hypothetical protein
MLPNKSQASWYLLCDGVTRFFILQLFRLIVPVRYKILLSPLFDLMSSNPL